MDFLDAFGIMKRHWVILLVGALVGLALMFGTLYSVGQLRETGRLERRSFTNYTIETQVLVVDPRFWMGRAGSRSPEQPDIFPKTVTLATTYAGLLSSDAVRDAAEARVGPTDADVTSEAVPQAPIIKVTIKGRDREQLVKFGIALEKALEEYLVQEQENSDIPKSERMSVRPLAKPQAKAVQSRQFETALLAFSAPLFVAFGIAVARDRRTEKWPDR